MNETRPAWVLEAIEIGKEICLREKRLDQLTYEYRKAFDLEQRELAQLWLRKAQLERLRGESCFKQGA